MPEIPLNPDLVIRAGRHRYRVLERKPDPTGSYRWHEVWLCVRCGQQTTPNATFEDCLP